MMFVGRATRYEKLHRLTDWPQLELTYKARDLTLAIGSRNSLVAFRKVRFNTEESIPQSSLREIGILKMLTSSHIVRLLDVEDHNLKQGILYLVQELWGDDLVRWTCRHRGPLCMLHIKQIVYQILKGLAHCHTCYVMHRDLKPQNVMINKVGHVKITGFGLGRHVHGQLGPLTHEVVTLWWRAPEILLGARRYSTAIDVWGLGCIFGELSNYACPTAGTPWAVVGQYAYLFPGNSEIDQLFRIFRMLGTPKEGSFLTLLPEYNTSFPYWEPQATPVEHLRHERSTAHSLFSAMLEYDPLARITPKEALKHEYFSEVVNDFYLQQGHWDTGSSVRNIYRGQVVAWVVSCVYRRENLPRDAVIQAVALSEAMRPLTSTDRECDGDVLTKAGEPGCTCGLTCEKLPVPEPEPLICTGCPTPIQ